MLTPGAKGWINKYFELVEKGEIKLLIERPDELRKLHYMHLVLSNCGIVFGFPNELIFAKDLDDSSWTNQEKLKVLLFESMIFVHMQAMNETFDKKEFLNSLHDFYSIHNARSISKIFKLIIKESNETNLESVLANRVDIKLNLWENKWWVNSLSNAFVYLDVILFDDFIHHRKSQALKRYSTFALNALNAITLSAYSDGIIEEKEKDMFNVFLASANLDENEREIAKRKFKEGSTFDDFSWFVKDHWLMKRFLLDISTLTVFSGNDALEEEIEFLNNFCEHFNIPSIELDEALAMVENFVLKSQNKVEFLRDTSSYEKVYSSLSRRWTKIILRNKNRLVKEMQESKEFLYLVKKSTTQELSKEEKDKMKMQFKDIAKSVPALAIFMLPGGSVLMPLLLKMIPDLVPSAFKSNELDENKGELKNPEENDQRD